MNPITERLDKIANVLEEKGYIKEATEIDEISNSIEKLAYRISGDPLYKSLSLSLQALKRGNADTAFGFLDNIARGMENRLKQYGNIGAVKSGVAMYQAAREALKKGDSNPQEVMQMINDAQDFFENAEAEVNRAQMKTQRYQPTDMVFTTKKE